MTIPGQDLHAAGVTFYPPATIEALNALERRLGYALPDEVRALYLDRDGEEEHDPERVLLARLQPLDQLNESLDVFDEFFEEAAPDFPYEFLPLWTDDAGNFYVYFLTGEECGMIGWAHHEVPFKIAPLFRDMTSLYAALLRAYREDSFDLRIDYPAVDAVEERETRVFDAHLAAMTPDLSAEVLQYHGTFVLTLCPAGREAEVLPLLHEADLAIETSHLLVERACTFALHSLLDAVRMHVQDNTICSNLLKAVTTIDAPGTHEALLALARDFPVALSASSLASALERLGFTRENLRDEESLFFGARIMVPNAPDGELVLRWA